MPEWQALETLRTTCATRCACCDAARLHGRGGAVARARHRRQHRDLHVINTLMLRPLPVREPEQLVELLSRYPGEPRMNGLRWRLYEHLRDENQSSPTCLGVSPTDFPDDRRRTRGRGGRRRVRCRLFFTALGVQPAIGRLIGAQDDQCGAPTPRSPSSAGPIGSADSIATRRSSADDRRQWCAGDGCWRRPAWVLRIPDRHQPDVWLPAALETADPAAEPPGRRLVWRRVMARLKPGVGSSRRGRKCACSTGTASRTLPRMQERRCARQATIEWSRRRRVSPLLRDQFATLAARR